MKNKKIYNPVTESYQWVEVRPTSEKRTGSIIKEWAGDVYTITLPGKPHSTNNLYRRNKYGGMYMTKEGKELKRDYQWEAKRQFRAEQFTDDVELSAVLYFDNQHDHDIDNYNKILLDALEGIVYKDDKQIQRLVLEKAYDKESPRIEIEAAAY